jgi:hypothetical protein
MELSDCESEVFVVERDSTVVLGAGEGAGVVEVSATGAGDAAGAGVVTTVGADGVCWHPVINISPMTAGARETMHLEQNDFIEGHFPDPLREPILVNQQHVGTRSYEVISAQVECL